MRRTVLAPCLLLVGLSGVRGPAAWGGDAPAAPPLAESPVDRLVAGLVEDRSAARGLAEEALAHADAATLRAVALALRDRLDAATVGADRASRPARTGAPPTVGVAHEVEWVRMGAADVAATLGAPAPDVDPVVVPATPALLEAWAKALRAGAITPLTEADSSGYEGQRVEVSASSQRAVVDDIEVTSHANGTTIADPIVGRVETGVRLAFTPRQRRAAGPIEVAFDAEVRRLHDPIVEETLDVFEGGATARVQRPEIVAATWQRTVTLPAHGEVFVLFPRGFAPTVDTRLVLRFRARTVAFPDAGPTPPR
ncbi:MAG: hypothetical protein JNM10_11640 [Planctomycetia bacterium]|nr:hypothetical protein [Planctomycetia bacterium]